MACLLQYLSYIMELTVGNPASESTDPDAKYTMKLGRVILK